MIDIRRLCAIRPYMYHLTFSQNVSRIVRTCRLRSAASLLQSAGLNREINKRREGPRKIFVNSEAVYLRDQDPLIRGNMELQDGLTFDEFVSEINKRVFFWPGMTDGPIEKGWKHYARYQNDRPAIVRCKTQSVIDANTESVFQYCKYNSGAPRMCQGRGSPRGRDTFINSKLAPFPASDVQEIVFLNSMTLPKDSELGGRPDGPWSSLF